MVVRCRPFSKREKEAGFNNVCQLDRKTRSITLLPLPNAKATTSSTGASTNTGTGSNTALNEDGGRTFTFDSVFDQESTQVSPDQ